MRIQRAIGLCKEEKRLHLPKLTTTNNCTIQHMSFLLRVRVDGVDVVGAGGHGRMGIRRCVRVRSDNIRRRHRVVTESVVKLGLRIRLSITQIFRGYERLAGFLFIYYYCYQYIGYCPLRTIKKRTKRDSYQIGARFGRCRGKWGIVAE